MQAKTGSETTSDATILTFLRDEGIGGIAVHIAQRVMSAADPGRILVSRTVKDLVVGSGIEFEDRGAHQLKGVPGEWALYEVTGTP